MSARWLAALLLAASLSRANAADSVETFYRSHPIQLIIGFASAGGYDTYARLLAAHIGDHIPGHPRIIAQSMPGAGSLKAAIYLATIAPRDGTVFGVFSRGIMVQPLFDPSLAPKFNPATLTWLGSISNETGLCVLTRASGITSLAKMRDTPFLLGGTAAGADSDIWANTLRTLFGLPIKLITGYPGSADITLAMERHEVAGHCGWSLSSFLSEREAAYKAGDMVITLQIAAAKNPRFPDIPNITELATDPAQAQALALILSRQSVARPFAAPPNLPSDRAAALRAAFTATMTDPAFLAEAKAQNLEIDPVDAAAVEKIVHDAYATPPDIVRRAAAAISDAN
jgi:tripartite-type tricarboxylate transporter receptor subunit TctC